MDLKISDHRCQQEEQSSPIPLHDAPIVSCYNDRIRPLLDTVDMLRHLEITQKGIHLPTIVVVGDQSSGKSSVLESLAGISLPRGHGMCTRVPLIMRLQNHPNSEPEIYLEFNGKRALTDEQRIADSISSATEEIVGTGIGVSKKPLTLIVKKNGIPDLTMIDLPGITRVPVHDQPEDIYEQISAIIMEYITPKESIILNVLSASDFFTCESIRMSQSVDKYGQRTLAVVTKADNSANDLLEKVIATADDVNIGLDYVWVRNRIGDESYAEAQAEEAKLFQTDTQLSKIDNSMVGIRNLAEKLMKIQATIVVKRLPDIVWNINHKLNANVTELNNMPKHPISVGEAMTTFMHILGSVKESLRKALLQEEFHEYPDSTDMHCRARLAEMLSKFYDELRSTESTETDKKFLDDEIKVLEETKEIMFPKFLSEAAFHSLLQKKVKAIAAVPFRFAEKTWSYVETMVVRVLMQHCENYPQLLSSARRAAQNLISKKKEQSIDWIKDILEMEQTDYTCNPEFTSSWNKLMLDQEEFMKKVIMRNTQAKSIRFGLVQIGHLHGIKVTEEAFKLKMRMTAYWDIVLTRIADYMVLHLRLSIQNLVKKEMQNGVIEAVIGSASNGLEMMLEESASVSEKRRKLQESIKLLKESKDVVVNIIDRVVADV